jgi:aspartokinase
MIARVHNRDVVVVALTHSILLQLQVVMKFGGSSLADCEQLDHVARSIVSQITTSGRQPRAIVSSAIRNTANNLLAAGQAAL